MRSNEIFRTERKNEKLKKNRQIKSLVLSRNFCEKEKCEVRARERISATSTLRSVESTCSSTVLKKFREIAKKNLGLCFIWRKKCWSFREIKLQKFLVFVHLTEKCWSFRKTTLSCFWRLFQIVDSQVTVEQLSRNDDFT